MNSYKPQERSDQIDLRVIFNIIWKRKIIIAAATAVIGLFSVLYSLSLPNIYESKVVLAPSTASESTNINISGTAGALARVAGIDLGGGSDKGPNINLAVEKITSRQFVKDFINKNNFQPELLASKNWDSAQNIIVYSKKGYDSKNDSLTYSPRDIDVYKGYMDRIGVFFDKRTKFTHISFKHYSPYFAKELLDNLVLTINNDIRDIDVKVAKESIKFLEDQIAKTNVSDLKLIFSKLIEKNIKTVLLAEVNPEFVFTVVDPAYVPDLKSAPSRGLMCILITIFGFLFVLTFLVIFDYIQLRKKS
ncbi:MAG: hypothetical protein CMD46_00840 [Gammaproteobacteria bacterium]|nr:hypothetical protein [Gammaproteobacteria bacterium]|tara:strand:- start:32992 stop:33906 length:915 start_codon:yes stop_codon:yes gene_type:complete